MKKVKKATYRVKRSSLLPSLDHFRDENHRVIVLKKDINSHVSYYREGWRVGTLVSVSVKKGTVRIAPMAGYKGKQPRAITVPLSDVKQI